MIVCLLCMSMLWFVCKAQFSDISQPVSFHAVELGERVTIKCVISYTARTRVWYKVTTERKLQLVASIDTLFNVTKFEKQFENHFSLKSDTTSSHLIISRTVSEDAGMYYCGVIKLEDVSFGQGTFLMIEGAKMISDSVVQQPESHSVHLGDSVTLTCSVQSHWCDAKHTSVTWLKNSDHSAPEMIYSSGNQKYSCQTVSGDVTYVYDLLVRNLSSEDAGVYYCIVTSCGQIQFGNGTRIKIHIKGDVLNKSLDLSPGVISLILSNIIFGVVTLMLVWTLCKNHKKAAAASSRCSNESPEETQNGDSVVYASVTSAPRISSCRSAPVKHDTDKMVYSAVMHRQQN